MAESTPPQPDVAVTNGEPALGTEQKPQRERRQHTPPEELYDLTKPIPKVRDKTLSFSGESNAATL